MSGCVLRSSARAASPCEIACLYWAVFLDDPSDDDDDGEGAAATKMPSQSSSIGNRSSGGCCPCFLEKIEKGGGKVTVINRVYTQKYILITK